ncbi:MAG: MFS transporter [Deinococcota bacterium]
MLNVLKQRHLLILWLALVFSSIGDRLYEIAVVWLAIQLTGSEAGFVLATQAAARLIFGLVGGVYADRLNRRKLMITTDVTRALVVLSVPLAAVFGEINLWHLVLVASVVGGLNAFFEPALIASLPHLTNTARDLNAFNGLIDVTSRLARVIGPGLAGVLLALMPMSQFFTIDAFSFGLSAAAVFLIGKGFTWHASASGTDHTVKGIWSDMQEAGHALRLRPHVLWCIAANSLTNLLWGAVFVVGLALMIDARFQGNAGMYGLVVSAYGIGNVISNVVISHLNVQRHVQLIFVGTALLGFGFLLVSLAQDLRLLFVLAAFTAIGGPMKDLPLLTMIQREFPPHVMGKVFSVRAMAVNVGYSLGLALAAPLYTLLPLTVGMASLSCFVLGVGSLGIVVFWRHKPQPVTYQKVAAV